jgi:hypothetical protein
MTSSVPTGTGTLSSADMLVALHKEKKDEGTMVALLAILAWGRWKGWGGKSCCLTYSFFPCFSRKRSWAPAPTSSSAAQSSSTADTNEPEASPASSSDALNKLLSGLPEVKQAKGRLS